MTLYFDYNATTPLDPRVHSEINRCFSEEWGNAGSPHEFGQRAKALVHAARDRIARVVAAKRHDIVFTSGATESNNLAILGLAEHGLATNKCHIVSTQIEHKAVLEPLAALARRGFEITLVPTLPTGRVDPQAVLAAARPDTLLISIMHVNNETGVIQPIREIADQLGDRDAKLHVDAAQGFGKDLPPLQHPRIDFISISSHKIFGPAGVGALVVRHRKNQPIHLTPLLYGGGQELGLRPGTIPVALVSGFGLAAELAQQECEERRIRCEEIRRQVLQAISILEPVVHSDPAICLPHVLNLSFSGLEDDEIVDTLQGIAAVATGSACTSVCATASHVLAAMKVPQPALDSAVRLSWSHLITDDELKNTLFKLVNAIALAKSRKATSQSTSESR